MSDQRRNEMRTHFKMRVILAVLCAVCLAGAGNAALQTLDSADILSNSEPTLTNAATVAFSSDGAHTITVQFGPGSGPMSGTVLATIGVDEGVIGSLFFSNYIQEAVNTIQFGVTGDGYQPAGATLQLLASNGHVWYSKFPVSSTVGERLEVLLPLTLESGWVPNFSCDDLHGALAADLQNIIRVAIMLKPGTPEGMSTSPEQSYTIDNVVLVNDDDISSPPAVLAENDLEQGLLSRFGYGYGTIESLTAEMKGMDTDGDGMADYVEIYAESDPDFAESIFRIDALQLVGGNPVVKWVCVNGEQYTLKRASAPDGPYVAVNASPMAASGTGFMSNSDTAAGEGGPVFYRVVKEN